MHLQNFIVENKKRSYVCDAWHVHKSWCRRKQGIHMWNSKIRESQKEYCSQVTIGNGLVLNQTEPRNYGFMVY